MTSAMGQWWLSCKPARIIAHLGNCQHRPKSVCSLASVIGDKGCKGFFSSTEFHSQLRLGVDGSCLTNLHGAGQVVQEFPDTMAVYIPAVADTRKKCNGIVSLTVSYFYLESLESQKLVTICLAWAYPQHCTLSRRRKKFMM